MTVRIKICGVTSAADAETVARLGADAVGFNFYAPSPRCITPPTANDIARALPPFVEPVALFVKQAMPELLAQAARFSWLRTIQWHGDAFPELAAAGSYQWIVAAPIRDSGSLKQVNDYLQVCQTAGRLPSAVLVDAYVSGQYGGTGQAAPWELLRDFHPLVPVILAGGLTPENVAEAIRVVQPFAVDVSSGVESIPGRKDMDKVRRFIENARAEASRLGL